MAGTVTHLAIADKMYEILGDGVITNLPLFYGGNIAPDAIHAKRGYRRSDKKHSHLCDGIRSYGYGYPEVAALFRSNVNNFVETYYFNADVNKDLHLGYITHLLADEFYLLSVYKRLEKHLEKSGADVNAPGFRKSLADEVNNDGYKEFFNEANYINEISVNDYGFNQNVSEILEAAWDYEIMNYVCADEINASKRWVIQKYFPGKSTNAKSDSDRDEAVKLVVRSAEYIIDCMSGKNGFIKVFP